jgi:ABC-type sugar transport system ATPase subunit
LTKIPVASIFRIMIELKDVSYRYRSVESRAEGGDENSSILALDHVSLKLKEGESVSIIGSNGSGKTTLVKLFNALMVPDEGEVWVDGVDARDKKSQKLIRQKVGMVFQNPDNQIISTSVEREIAFGLENLALPYDEMKERVEWALERFHLREYRNHSPHRLSGGEKPLHAAQISDFRRAHLASRFSRKKGSALADPKTGSAEEGDRDSHHPVQRGSSGCRQSAGNASGKDSA